MPGVVRGDPLYEALYALGILLLSWVAAWLLSRLLRVLMRLTSSRTRTRLDDLLLGAIRPSLVAFVVAQGLFVALTQVSFLDEGQDHINKAWVAVVLALVFVALQRILAALLTWYGSEIATRTRTDWDEKALPLLRRVANLVVLAIGALVVLDFLGISIAPLVAGLGIGGIAVALALQPTLANFISGTYMLSDGSIRPGDFIELQDGPMGTVEQVGWRSTRILTPLNNVVIIPNSKLSDTIVTNYNQPQPLMNVVLTCGVSYESDLRRVEQICIEVMNDLRTRLAEVEKTFDPLVRFREFADSNINFLCIMRAMNRGATFLVHHELMKALHHRFTKEGIEINYPVRKLVYASDGRISPALPLTDRQDTQR